MSKQEFDAERIVDIDLTQEMQDSFLEYSYSVIYARALPDARDGLKPVHRRIVYQMGEMGLRPDRGHVKSARVVGDVMGKLHPHGDSAIYDALVRMAQPFSLRVPLVDGHGNFGSLDDGPAASRYTEARLSAASLLMNESLDEDVVDFKPNYDAQLSEPSVLPAAFPNLLVNGATGIAVGMATNMPPHNLREVVAAAIYLLNNPSATTEDLMRFVPGPDLPNGGIIVGTEGIVEAYETGRGVFKTRAKVSVETVSPRKLGLVITELPYLVGPEKVIEKIKDGVNSKKIAGISDVTDLTDRTNGLKLVVELKTGFDPQAVLELLYRFTPMEDSFGINNVALVDGRPQTLGLRDLIGVYLAHRVLVTRRRSKNRLGKRKARLHLVEGLLKAILNIDEVIQVIRSSDEVDEARSKLRSVFDLSELQAEYILELRLRRLTKFSRIELDAEKDQLLSEIAELNRILESDQVLRDLVSAELSEVAEKYGDLRRTEILADGEVVKAVPAAKIIAAGAELSDEPCFVSLSSSGFVARSSTEQNFGESRSKHDASLASISTSTRSDIGFITSAGRIVRVHAGDIPTADQSFANEAVSVASFLGLSGSEKVINAIALTETNELAVATKLGTVKRIQPDYPAKDDFEIISLKEGDEVVGAAICDDKSRLVFIANDTQLLTFDASAVRPQGRPASGVAGISLSEGAELIFFTAISADNVAEATVLTAACSDSALPGTDPGSAKLSLLTEFPTKGRATGGVRSHKLLKGEDKLYFAWAGPSAPKLQSSDGKALNLSFELSKRDASGSKLSTSIVSAGV
jgi:DNA gyrase subunit A